MKKLIKSCLVALAALVVMTGVASAQSVGGTVVGKVRGYANGIGARQLDTRLRTEIYPVVGLDHIHWTSVSTAVRITGREDVIMALTTNTLSGATWTTSIAPMRYPRRLGVTFFDSAADSTLVAAYVDITGETWDGSVVSERVRGASNGSNTNIREASVVTTSIAFAKVTRIRVSDIAGSGATDQLIVFGTGSIALPKKLQSAQYGLVSICRIKLNTSADDTGCLPYDRFTVTLGAQDTIVNLISNACVTLGGISRCGINVGTIGTATQLYARGDSFIITYRASP